VSVDEAFDSLPLPVDPENPNRRLADPPIYHETVEDAAARGLADDVEAWLRSRGGAA